MATEMTDFQNSTSAGHFGWFNLPLEPISTKKVIGAAAMIIGIIFINSK